MCPGLSISSVFGSLICFTLIPPENEKIIRFSFDSVSHVLLCHTGDGLSAVAVRVFFIWILFGLVVTPFVLPGLGQDLCIFNIFGHALDFCFALKSHDNAFLSRLSKTQHSFPLLATGHD